MKFSFVAVAVLVAAGVGAYWWNKTHPATALTPENPDKTPQKVGPVQTSDPYASADEESGPLASPNSDPITEAAYHQSAVLIMTGAFGSDENTGGEEVLNLI